jgi:flagellar motility protein MotE (MotC chaperone)
LRVLLLLSIGFLYLFSAQEDSAVSFIKEKKEIRRLKQELNTFYNKEEEKYQARKKELDSLLSKIKSEKKAIQDLYDKNKDILKDIEGAVATKTTKIYNGMKPKVAASIFNKMIEDGKIEDVFDIILKLKEAKVTLILKFLSVDNAAILTQMLENFKVKN